MGHRITAAVDEINATLLATYLVHDPCPAPGGCIKIHTETLAQHTPCSGRPSPSLIVVLDHREPYKTTRRTSVLPFFLSTIPQSLKSSPSLSSFNYWPPVLSMNTTEETTSGTQR
jgi:hypothetical protein